MSTNTLRCEHKGGSPLVESVGGFSIADEQRAIYENAYACRIKETNSMVNMILSWYQERPQSVEVVQVPQPSGETLTGQGRLRMTKIHEPYQLSVANSPLQLVIGDINFYIKGSASVGGRHWILMDQSMVAHLVDAETPAEKAKKAKRPHDRSTKIKPVVFEFSTSAATIDGNLFGDVFLVTGVV